jgi:ribonuclease R
MNIEEQAIRYLFQSEPETAFCVPAIIKTLGLRGKAVKRLTPFLRELVRSGEIVEKRRGYYRAGVGVGTLTGTLRMTRSGAAVVTNEDTGKSVFIESHDVGRAIHGDRVTVSYRPGHRSDPVGTIRSIDEDAVREVVGTLRRSAGTWYVSPLNPIYRSDFTLVDPGKAKVGDRVVVRVQRDLNDRSQLVASLVEVIGPEDKPSLDTLSILRQFELPEAFPVAVMQAAESVAQRLKTPGNRLDLRDRFILTIDPATARDYDDAISLEKDADGHRVLGVHIADVSHFVEPGSPLDKEAYKRGTSVYLIDKVIPMLPEQLSNGVCSLVPGEDRLTFSVFITYDDHARVLKTSFAKSIINSKQRLAYEEALALLEDRPVSLHEGSLDPRTAPMLKETLNLTRQLKKIRERNDAMEMASQEVEIELNADGYMTGIHVASNDESHQMIECCMVAANEAVARELLTHKVPIISRFHDIPDEEKLAKLEMELRKLGIRPRNLCEPKELAALLRSTADHPLRYHIHSLILRSMRRALYSAEQHGHFGLALTYYTHFTSPIRRYPDLVLHRLLADYLSNPTTASQKTSKGWLERAAAQATDRENLADEAERALTEIKKYRFLQQQLDEQKPLEYDAVVVSVKNFGFFVDVIDLQVSGMVHIAGISKQFVNFNPTSETLSAGKLTIKAGMNVKVFIAKVDFPARRLDFAYVQGSAVDTWNGGQHAEETRRKAIAKQRNRNTKGKRGPGSHHRRGPELPTRSNRDGRTLKRKH